MWNIGVYWYKSGMGLGRNTKPITIMQSAELNLDLMFSIGSDISEQDIAEYAGGTATENDIRSYMMECICTPYDGHVWVEDELLPISNLDEALDAMIRGYESNL